MDERRRIPRKYLMFYSRVFDEKTGELVGHIIDITRMGMMLISEKPVEVGQTLQLRLEVPLDFQTKQFISFAATSKWCGKDVDPHFYNTGFEIDAISLEDLDLIERLVEAYGLRDH